MEKNCLSILPCLGLLAAVLISPRTAPGGEPENWDRLRAMPREQRALLAENLQRFDMLERSQRDAIRSLDAKLASLSPPEQAHYRAVLRSYHLWVNRLPEAQRNELNAVPPDQRLALATKVRAAEQAAQGRQTVPLFLQIANFSMLSPFDMAHLLKLWFELTPVQRTELEKLPPGAERQGRLLEYGRRLKVRPENRLSTAEEDAVIARMESALEQKGGIILPRKKDATKDARFKHRLAENYYFLEHPPEKVDAAHLLRFENALPSWVRSSFDPLPPEESRRRLKVLYRLVFPAPAEMPQPKPVAPPESAKPKPVAAPSPPKPKSDAPF